MSNIKKIQSVGIFFSVALVLFLYTMRVININQQYPNPIIETLPIMTQFDMGDGLILTVEDGDLFLPTEAENKYKEQFSANTFEWVTDLGESKVFLIRLRLYNEGNIEIGIPFHRLNISCSIWSNGIHIPLLIFLNDIDESEENAFIIEPGGTKEFIAPYFIYEMQFSNIEDFNKINIEEAYLTPTLYPIKYCLLVA